LISQIKETNGLNFHFCC